MAESTEIARLMRLQLVALGYAVDDVEADRYSAEERHHLAGGLDTLAAALRGQDEPIVVETKCNEPKRGELRQRPGLIEWGRLS